MQLMAKDEVYTADADGAGLASRTDLVVYAWAAGRRRLATHYQ